jgi:8-oxo-dGTP pyrophosphatase MutT (NUDIX family)
MPKWKETPLLNLLSRLTNDVYLMLRRPPRQQYAALCYRIKKKQGDVEILVLTSRDTGRWVIPKGWPMEGKQAHTVAAQEAYEEAGVKGKVEKEILGFYEYQKKLSNGMNVLCKVQVHALEVEELIKNFPEKNSRKLEWVSVEEAASRVNEPELKTLIRSFGKRISTVVPAKI